MKFSTDNPYVRCYFDDDKPEEGFVELRTLTFEKITEIRKKTVKKRVEFKRQQRYEVEEVNERLRDELTWDYCIGDWSQVLDDQGQEIENTKENKLMLMGKSVAFSSFVGQNLEDIGGAQEKLKEAETKN